MRPSRRLLIIALIALALSVLAVAAGPVPDVAAVTIWAALAAVLALDILISPTRRSVSPSLEGPEEVFSGETATYLARVVAKSGLVPRGIEARLALAAELGDPKSVALRATGEMAEGALDVRAHRRGTYAIPALWLKWPSRFGLLEIIPKFTLPTMLRVAPNIRPIASGQIDVKIHSELYGVKQNLARGEGSEFHQLRDFTTGMDTRAIDWKRSARHRGLVAKEMLSERNHQVILCLDNGYLMREEIDGLPKIDHSINAALALAWAAGIGGDLVGVFSFDAQPRHYLPPQPGRAGFARIRSHMASLDYHSAESNLTLAMAYVNGQLKRRSLIVIFSDFVDTTSAELLVENIRVLSRHHVIIFVAICDPLIAGKMRGEKASSLQDVAEAVAASQMLRERQIVLENLSRLGVMCIDTDPKALTARLVSTYITIKAREMI